MSTDNKKNELISAYQKAIDLQIFEGSVNWSRFGTMLTAQIILVAVIALSVQQHFFDKLRLFGHPILPVIGILLCVVWWEMTSRGYSWFTYWVLSARELEDKIGNEDIQILKRGERFRDNKVVEFDLIPEKAFYYRPYHSRLIRTDHAAYIAIVLFGLIYFLFFFI